MGDQLLRLNHFTIERQGRTIGNNIIDFIIWIMAINKLIEPNKANLGMIIIVVSILLLVYISISN